MGRVGITCCLAYAVLFLAGAVSGAERAPGIIGSDDRRPAASDDARWDGVGQVNVGGYRRSGRCTGTLVRADTVVTAAHCVIDGRTGGPAPLKDIHFLAGVTGAAHKGHARAKCLQFPARDGGAVTSGVPPAAADLVLIGLDTALAIPPVPVARGIAGAPGLKLTHAAYAQDRRFRLSLHQDCQVLKAGPGAPLWQTDCDTQPASSGGPLFVNEGGGLALAAIMIGAGQGDSNIVLDVQRFAGFLKDPICR
jgi:protease YdgD